MTSTVSSPPVQPGDIVGGKYEVIRALGKGGMGYVVAARHTTLDQIVAIKLLVRTFGDHDESVARFLREARAAARIESDHICKVFDTGTLPSGIPYLVMEVLDGIDLEQELDRRGRLPVEEAVDYTMQALDAIATAHKLGVVHRDLKPANLFLTERADGTRRLKVFDFGISKTDDPESDTDTQGIIGTPAYMSPEQARNAKKTDHRSDIFSLGAILFEMLAGQPPHLGESIGEILQSVMNKPAAELAGLRPDLPPELCVAVMRAIESDREARFFSAQEFARALAPFASVPFANLAQSIPAPGGSLRMMMDSSRAPATSGAETVAGWTQGGLLELYHRRGYVVFGLVALALSAVVLIALIRNRETTNSASNVAPITQAAAPPVTDDRAQANPINAGVAGVASGASSAAAVASVSSASASASSPAAIALPKQQKSDSSPPRALPTAKNKGNPLLDTRE